LEELENFSIKSFTESDSCNNYFQVSRTIRNEVRLVSRSVVPDYYPNDRLGDCAFCRELKFYLRGRVYADEVYYQFYLNHPFDQCRARGYVKFRRMYHETKGYLKFEPSERIEYKLNEGEFIDHTKRIVKLENIILRRLLVDRYFHSVPVVEKRKDHLQHVHLIVTDEMFITKDLMCCKGIYVYTGDELSLMYIPTEKLTLIPSNNPTPSYSKIKQYEKKDRVEQAAERNKNRPPMSVKKKKRK